MNDMDAVLEEMRTAIQQAADRIQRVEGCEVTIDFDVNTLSRYVILHTKCRSLPAPFRLELIYYYPNIAVSKRELTTIVGCVEVYLAKLCDIDNADLSDLMEMISDPVYESHRELIGRIIKEGG